MNNIRILVVDDHPTNLGSIAKPIGTRRLPKQIKPWLRTEVAS